MEGLRGQLDSTAVPTTPHPDRCIHHRRQQLWSGVTQVCMQALPSTLTNSLVDLDVGLGHFDELPSL